VVWGSGGSEEGDGRGRREREGGGEERGGGEGGKEWGGGIGGRRKTKNTRMIHQLYNANHKLVGSHGNNVCQSNGVNQ